MKLTSTALDVAGTIASDGLNVSGDGTFTGDVHIRDDLFLTGPNPVITLTDNDTADEYTKLQNADGTTYLDSRNGASNGPIIFRGHGGGVTTQYGRFTSTGNFGINDTNPAEKLSVTGNIAATGKVSVVNSSGTVWSPEMTGSVSYESQVGEVAVRNTVDGVSNSYASIFLEAGGQSNGSQIGTARIAAVKTSSPFETDLAFATRGVGGVQREHMRLKSDGTVGIGKTNPTCALDVVGAIKVGPTANADKPYLNISNLSLSQLPKNHVFLRQTTSERGDNNAVQIQRIVDTNDGHVSPSALKVLSVLNHNNGQAENAVSAVIDSYTNTSGPGVTALNGQVNKHGTAGAHFAGHFQIKDYNIYATQSDVTPNLGMEINMPAIGLDHPTKYGVRRAIDIIARTNQEPANWNTAGGNDGNGETGAAIVIRTDNITDAGWRYGLVIHDKGLAGAGIVKTGINIDTSGAYGARIEGTANAGAALSIDSNAYMEMGIVGGTSRIRMKYNAATDKIEFYKGPTLKASIDMGSGASAGDMN